MAFPICFILTADATNLSRVNVASLPEQTLMELFVDGFERKNLFQDRDGAYTDCHTWIPVHVTSGAVFQFVTRCSDRERPLCGELRVKYLPQTVFNLDLTKQCLYGPLDTSELPPALVYLVLGENSLTGSFKTECLPPLLICVFIPGNNFSGTLNLSALPENLTTFSAERNAFVGKVDFSSLPVTLKWLNISHNAITGSIKGAKMPTAIQSLMTEGTAVEWGNYVPGNGQE